MSGKAEKIKALMAGMKLEGVDAHYAGYFECFNRGLFYEAHDVLEQLWLPQRGGGNGNFYKGLIQLAGAFVHLQKDRLGPATALLKLARKNLVQYPPEHESLDVREVLALIEHWLGLLAAEAPILFRLELFRVSPCGQPAAKTRFNRSQGKED